jgi:hypothetical protein
VSDDRLCASGYQWLITDELTVFLKKRKSHPGGIDRKASYTHSMQLRAARLCLDCEEVHAELRCPVCASDSFAYLSRWIPVEERRLERRAQTQPAERPSRRSRWVAGGAIGLAAYAASRWLSRGNGTAEHLEADQSEADDRSSSATVLHDDL